MAYYTSCEGANTFSDQLVTAYLQGSAAQGLLDALDDDEFALECPDEVCCGLCLRCECVFCSLMVVTAVIALDGNEGSPAGGRYVHHGAHIGTRGNPMCITGPPFVHHRGGGGIRTSRDLQMSTVGPPSVADELTMARRRSQPQTEREDVGDMCWEVFRCSGPA